MSDVETEIDVIVIGAGIGGLVAAVTLQSSGVRTLVLEASDRVGGLLAATSLGDAVVDAGAESFATRTSAVADLIAEHAKGLEVTAPRPVGAWLLSGSRGRAHRRELPGGTVLGIPSRPWAREVRRVIGVVGSARASLDGVLPRRIGAGASTLGRLVEVRMGARVRDRLVDTICRGVYSSPAAEVAVDSVAPRLRQELRRTGSLAGAVAALASGARPGAAVAGISGGLWRLAPALADDLRRSGGSLAAASSVVALERSPAGGIRVVTDARTYHAPHVVVASSGTEAGRLLSRLAPRIGEVLDARPAAGVTVAAVRFKSERMSDFPVGTGVLVAQRVGRRAKALTHANAKWDWLDRSLPRHEHVARLSFDGSAASVAELASDREVLAEELRALTGIPILESDLIDVTVTAWPDSIVPLAAPTRTALEGAAEEAERAGVLCVGAWIAGTGLATVVPHARDRAERLAALIQSTRPRQGAEL